MFKDVLKKYLLLFNEIKYQNLEITSEEENIDTGLLYLSVKIVGKCISPVPKDPLILLGESGSKYIFSETDFNWILSTILENQKRLIEKKYRKKFTLIKHQFSEQLKEPLIVYKNHLTEQIKIKPAKEIYSNIDMLKQFSPEDSACIGNIVGCNETEKDLKICYELKQNNVFKFDISASTG